MIANCFCKKTQKNKNLMNFQQNHLVNFKNGKMKLFNLEIANIVLVDRLKQETKKKRGK
jgi:hypothetical protein